ncbi:signal peptidase I [Paenalkalicoccus suaedae]|uniref:Signal peptidase I n=1 Tax=Paenalkalicoccus suaedae TaxID=2592382 RepID=A0A859FA81_9BACI|nr:signal peptidase I [Paenalkalicoccus suaedae]QKS69817.1 signal peptidase I [Paenalkalicoccus suaedae]
MTLAEEQQKKGSWLMPIILAVGVALLVRTFFFAPYVVEGASMQPSLFDRDRILVNKTTTWLGEFERGDIVIIQDESNRHYVKRVIAMPGETLEMQNGTLMIDGQSYTEPYLDEMLQYSETIEETVVPDGEFYVMGDNRGNSLDSRNQLGTIDEDDIVGKSVFVFFPFSNVQLTN